MKNIIKFILVAIIFLPSFSYAVSLTPAGDTLNIVPDSTRWSIWTVDNETRILGQNGSGSITESQVSPSVGHMRVFGYVSALGPCGGDSPNFSGCMAASPGGYQDVYLIGGIWYLTPPVPPPAGFTKGFVIAQATTSVASIGTIVSGAIPTILGILAALIGLAIAVRYIIDWLGGTGVSSMDRMSAFQAENGRRNRELMGQLKNDELTGMGNNVQRVDKWIRCLQPLH